MEICYKTNKHLSLIGMSGSGKTYWAKQLENYGFLRISIDDLIEEKLKSVLKKNGFRGIEGVANWMGQPYEERYHKNARQYLSAERQSMQEVLEKIKNGTGQNIVIDTTGSVIYTGQRICKQLKQLTTIIYLYTPSHIVDKMYRLYLDDPKPVIWGDKFVKQPHQTNQEALASSYPKLLAYRAAQYKKYADITLNCEKLRDPNFTVSKFIKQISIVA